MGPVPEHLINSVDWQLVCEDGEKLPCHSLILSAVSKVLADLIDSTQIPPKGVLIDVPLPCSSDLGKIFLHWVYGRKSDGFNTDIALQLAELSHYLDSPGLADCCDFFLWANEPVEYSSLLSDTTFLDNSGARVKKSTMEWALMTRKYGMPRVLQMCIDRLARRKEDWDTVTPDELEGLGAGALAQLLSMINPHPYASEPHNGYLAVVLQ